MAWFIIKSWLDNDISSDHGLIYQQAMAWIKPSHGLIYQQAMAWYINKPWLDMSSSHCLICYQARAWYVIKPGLDLLSSLGLIYQQAMAWFVIKPWLDIIKPWLDMFSSIDLERWRHSENRASSKFWLDTCVLTLYPVRTTCILCFFLDENILLYN